MPNLYAFRNKDTAEKLNRFAGTLEPSATNVVRSSRFMTPNMVMKTKAGGIPARTGDTAGVAKCLLLGAAPDGTMTEIGAEADVLNPFSSAIAGDTYIVASVCQEVLVAVAEDCG
jgi:hypothetical protein